MGRATLPYRAAGGSEQPQPVLLGRGTLLISGSVSLRSRSKASLPDSSSSGWLGDGTRKPKSSASLLKDACRMKCWVFVAGSQMRMTVWSALTTGLPDGGAGQQASPGGE